MPCWPLGGARAVGRAVRLVLLCSWIGLVFWKVCDLILLESQRLKSGWLDVFDSLFIFRVKDAIDGYLSQPNTIDRRGGEC